MTNTRIVLYITVLTVMLFFSINSAKARNIHFQPRLETGVMKYEFEAESFSFAAIPVQNHTSNKFKYDDLVPFVSAGMTVFMDRLFLDISGQYAFDGDDNVVMGRSGFYINKFYEDEDYEVTSFTARFVAWEPRSEVKFDRTEMALSLGYALSRNFSLFVGYKDAETEFFEEFEGPFSINFHYSKPPADPDEIVIRKYGGKIVGSATYRFRYSGPFLGCIRGFDFTKSRYLKGVFSTHVALAFLDGKLESTGGRFSTKITWANDIHFPEPIYQDSPDNRNLSGRSKDTQGDALGLKVGLTWRGITPWERLSYNVSVSGYRYEFDADSKLSDMNETTTQVKIGLTYLF